MEAIRCRHCKRSIDSDSNYCKYCGHPAHRSGTRRPPDSGSAYQRGHTWTAVWMAEIVNADGSTSKQKRTKGGFASEETARAYSLQMAAGGAIVDVQPLRFFWAWYEENELENLSKSRRIAARKAWSRIEAAGLSSINVDRLDVDQLQEALDSQCSTYDTGKDFKTLLSHLLGRAVVKKQLQTNLAPALRLPSSNWKETQPFNAGEIDKLWTAYRDGDLFTGYILVMIYSGMMPGELFRCKRAMIDWDRGCIIGCGMKTDLRRTDPIYYPDIIAPVLRELCDNSKSTVDNLLPMAEDNFRRRFDETLAGLGIRPLKPYSCRHTTATALADARVEPSTIQKIMRHTNFSTTSKYIHPDDDTRRAGLEAIAPAPAPSEKK